jgi:hypothetical protein
MVAALISPDVAITIMPTLLKQSSSISELRFSGELILDPTDDPIIGNHGSESTIADSAGFVNIPPSS